MNVSPTIRNCEIKSCLPSNDKIILIIAAVALLAAVIYLSMQYDTQAGSISDLQKRVDLLKNQEQLAAIIKKNEPWSWGRFDNWARLAGQIPPMEAQLALVKALSAGTLMGAVTASALSTTMAALAFFNPPILHEKINPHNGKLLIAAFAVIAIAALLWAVYPWSVDHLEQTGAKINGLNIKRLDAEFLKWVSYGHIDRGVNSLVQQLRDASEDMDKWVTINSATMLAAAAFTITGVIMATLLWLNRRKDPSQEPLRIVVNGPAQL